MSQTADRGPHLLTCGCGSTTFEEHEVLTISLAAALGSRGKGRVAPETRTTVVRCTECNQSADDIVAQL